MTSGLVSFTDGSTSASNATGPDSAPRGRTAVVTVTFGSASVLPDFLASLSSQTSDDWSLIVVDNASQDGTISLLREWDGPLFALQENAKNVGFAAGMNQGIELARDAGFDSILMINNDTLFEPDFLQDLLRSPDRRQGVILAPLVRYAGEPERIWFGGGRFTWRRGAFQAEMLESTPTSGDSWPATFAPGCCLLIDIDVFDRVGMLDEDFFVYWEDVDFCWRCLRAGIEIRVLRSPSMLHRVSSLTGGSQSPFSIRMWHLNQVIFIDKHFGMTVLTLQFPLMVLKIAARFITGRDSAVEARLRWSALREAVFKSRSRKARSN